MCAFAFMDEMDESGIVARALSTVYCGILALFIHLLIRQIERPISI